MIASQLRCTSKSVLLLRDFRKERIDELCWEEEEFDCKTQNEDLTVRAVPDNVNEFWYLHLAEKICYVYYIKQLRLVTLQ